MSGRNAVLAGIVAIACALMTSEARAQEMEPRAYSSSPTGTNFLVVGFTRSTGDVLFDPTLPIEDVTARLNAVALGLGRTFSLGGRVALLTAALPYSWGDIEGRVAEQSRQITNRGSSIRASKCR